MNQNSPAPSISNAKERKVSSLGLNINLIQFTKFLSTFGIVLSPFLFGTSIACLWSGSLGKLPFFVPGIFFLILSGFFLFLCINLKTRCDVQDIDGIENIAQIANYFLGSCEIFVYIVVFGAWVFWFCFALAHKTGPPFILFFGLVGIVEFFIPLAASTMKIHALRTRNNSLLGSYIMARYVIICLLGLVPVWNAIMIFSTGMTLVLHAIRSENSNEESAEMKNLNKSNV